MKQVLIAVLMLSSIAVSQNKKPPTTKPRPAVPTCPSGKGCESFRQLWLAKEDDVRGADWACFPRTFSGEPIKADRFFLLNVSESLEYTSYENGIIGDYAAGVDDGAIAHSTQPSKWTKMGEAPLEGQRFGNHLNFVRTYNNPQKEQVQHDFAVNLATGRYSSRYTVEGTQAEENGECIAPSPSAKKLKVR